MQKQKQRDWMRQLEQSSGQMQSWRKLQGTTNNSDLVLFLFPGALTILPYEAIMIRQFWRRLSIWTKFSIILHLDSFWDCVNSSTLHQLVMRRPAELSAAHFCLLAILFWTWTGVKSQGHDDNRSAVSFWSTLHSVYNEGILKKWWQTT